MPSSLTQARQSACRSIVQFLPNAVLLLDEKLRVVLANETASLLFQIPVAQLHNLPITVLVPHAKLDKLLLDFGGQRKKVIEASLPPRQKGLAPTTLKIVAARLRPQRRRNGAALSDDAGLRGEYRVLVVEDISDRAVLERLLVESEKQAAMGQLAAGILHEISNPLACLGSNLLFVQSQLEATADREQVRRALDASIDQLNAMRRLLGTLSGFPRRSAPKFAPADLREVVRTSVAFITSEAQRQGIRVVLSLAPSAIRCEMDVRLVRQVLLNLFKNSMEAMPDGGRLEIRTRLAPAADDGRTEPTAVVEVLDTGVGIAEADLRKVFRPLFSTKPRGSGLGLSFCRQAIEEHGGHIRLTSRGVGHGTAVILTLPLAQNGASENFD